MSWFADLADKAETLLNNLDEKTGVALRNQNILKPQHGKRESERKELPPWKQRPARPKSVPKNVLPAMSKVPDVPKSPLVRPIPLSHSLNKYVMQEIDDKLVKQKKNPCPNKVYDLDHNPKTLVEELPMSKSNVTADHRNGFKNRRLSLPDNVEFMDKKCLVDKCRNTEIENALLKNEVNIMNNEVAQLLYKLRTAEQANREPKQPNGQPNNYNTERQEVAATERIHLNENLVLEQSLAQLKDENKKLLHRLNSLEALKIEKLKETLKYEKDLKYSQNIINDLELELAKTKGECQQIQSDWDAYKLRVKNMLNAKDKEIKTLFVGPSHPDDTKEFIMEITKLRSEREELIKDLTQIRNEYNEIKLCMRDLEHKSHSTEKIIAALREALKEERAIRNKLEADCMILHKEHKKYQTEASHIIANLREEVNEKERMKNVKCSPSEDYQSSGEGSLNVADYDFMQDTLANEKIQCLTDTLVTKQRKVDSLIAENTMMRIQMEKLESKYKNDLAALKMNHSVVHLNDNDASTRERARSRKYIPESILSRLSVTIGTFMRRHPLFRMFVIIYMVGLHLWVLLILLTYSPDGQNSRQIVNFKH